jgi:predicted Zn-ribbon and HTH transcriptional regulator
MYRKDLISLLKDNPTSLNELSLILKVDKKDLEDDLHHLFRSLRAKPLNPVLTAAICRKCGFEFHKDKLHKPGKCPLCNGTWISEPLISIEERR